MMGWVEMAGLKSGAPPPDVLRKEAAQWFARLNTKQVSAATLEAFRQWRKAPGRRDAYAEIEAAWAQTAQAEGQPQVQAALRSALEKTNPQPWAVTPRRRGLAWGGLVAALGLIVVVGIWRPAGPWPGFGHETYATAVGEQRSLRLADGSRVWLDTDTRLSIHLAASRRDVTLHRGQAMFDVARDPARPFTVRAGETSVRALGTRFDVRRSGDQVRVTLVEGKVQVAQPRSEALTLSPGQQVLAADTLGRPTQVDLTSATSWTEGRIVFEAAPLHQAVAEVNRYSPRKIILDAPRAANDKVTGAFDSGDLDAFVLAVSQLHGLEVAEADDDRVRLVPAHASP